MYRLMSRPRQARAFGFRLLILSTLCVLVLASFVAAETTSQPGASPEPAAEDRSLAGADQDRDTPDSPEPSTMIDGVAGLDSRAGGGQQNAGPPSGECLPVPPDPLPTNGCYACLTTIPECGPPEIECKQATSHGRKFCSITVGGGSIMCQITGSSCTTI